MIERAKPSAGRILNSDELTSDRIMLTRERFLKVTGTDTVALISPAFLDHGKNGAKMKTWVWREDEPEDAT